MSKSITIFFTTFFISQFAFCQVVTNNCNAVKLSSGLQIVVNGTIKNNSLGSISNDGILSSTSDLENYGFLSGIGSFNYLGNIINTGTIEPGNSNTGTMSVTGMFDNGFGSLQLEIGGVTAIDNDLLNVNGTVLCNGTINVTFINSYVPTISDTFILITGTSVAGTFNTINTPTNWVLEYTSTTVVLKYGPACATTTTWDGLAWNNGTPNSNVAAIIAGNYSGNGFSACTLNVTGTAVVNIPSNETLNITGIVNVANTASLTLNNNANLVQTQDVDNIGNITVLRESSPVIRLDYVAWSSPVDNQNLLSFSPSTLTNRFYTYNPAGTDTPTSWIPTTPASTNFSSGTGYLIRTPNNWNPSIYTPYGGSFTGIPKNGDFNVATTTGYNLIGNPYPSQLTANTFIANNSTLGVGTLYFWAHVIPASGGTYAQNNYASYTTAGGVAAAAGGAQPDGNIQIGQGFLTNISTPGDVVFNNSQRKTGNSGQFFKDNLNVEKNRIWLDLTSPNNLHNQMMIAYMTNASNDIDNSIDGKLFGNTNSVIYNVIDNDKYVIQGRALPFTDEDSVLVGFIAKNNGNYTITLSQFDGLFSSNQNIYLKDNFLNTTHNIKETPYNFTSEIGEFNNRFEIVYRNALLSTSTNTINTNNIVVFKNSNSLEIQSNLKNIYEVIIFDIRGRKISKKSKINSKQISFNNLTIKNEVVLVKIIDTDGLETTKKIIF